MKAETFSGIIDQARAAVISVRMCVRSNRTQTNQNVARAQGAANAAVEHLRACNDRATNVRNAVRQNSDRAFIEPLNKLKKLQVHALRRASSLPPGGSASLDHNPDVVYRTAISKAWAVVREVEAEYNMEVE